MMDEGRLLIAIPTFSRPKDIGYFLEEMSFLSEYPNVVVGIFDSSKEQDTQVVVDDYRARGFNNMTYERINSCISSNEKMFLIFEKYRTIYEYIWILHDHTVFAREAFDFILNNLSGDKDFVFLKTQGKGYGIKQYNDINVFCQETAWLLGKMGAAILKSNPILFDLDWDYYKEKYLSKTTINFSHVGFYFERISEIPSLRIFSIEFPKEQFYDTHKYERLSWESESVRICTQCWGSVIWRLPRCYTNKLSLIQSIDKYFLTTYKLIEYRKKGYYGVKEFIKYKKWIHRVFPKMYIDALKIAISPFWYIKKLYILPLIKTIKKEKYNGKKIFIYGAGKHGVECLNFLEALDVKIDGFLVTSQNGNPHELRGYRVYELNEKLKEKERIFTILSVMEEMQKEIITELTAWKDKGVSIDWCSF